MRRKKSLRRTLDCLALTFEILGRENGLHKHLTIAKTISNPHNNLTRMESKYGPGLKHQDTSNVKYLVNSYQLHIDKFGQFGIRSKPIA